MFVKNIIKNTAQILGLDDVVDFINSGIVDCDDEQVNEEIKNLIFAVNVVNNNIASNYIELIGKACVYNQSEIMSLNKISNNQIIEIKKVFLNNKSIDFKVVPEGLKTALGNLEILYSYFPSEVSFDDKIDYYTKVNELIFSQGVAGEYLFLKGAIDDAYMWDKKFKQSLINLLRPKKNLIMPTKRWC